VNQDGIPLPVDLGGHQLPMPHGLQPDIPFDYTKAQPPATFGMQPDIPFDYTNAQPPATFGFDPSAPQYYGAEQNVFDLYHKKHTIQVNVNPDKFTRNRKYKALKEENDYGFPKFVDFNYRNYNDYNDWWMKDFEKIKRTYAPIKAKNMDPGDSINRLFESLDNFKINSKAFNEGEAIASRPIEKPAREEHRPKDLEVQNRVKTPEIKFNHEEEDDEKHKEKKEKKEKKDKKDKKEKKDKKRSRSRDRKSDDKEKRDSQDKDRKEKKEKKEKRSKEEKPSSDDILNEKKIMHQKQESVNEGKSGMPHQAKLSNLSNTANYPNESKVEGKIDYSNLHSANHSNLNVHGGKDEGDLAYSNVINRDMNTTDGIKKVVSEPNIKPKTEIIIKKKPQPTSTNNLALSGGQVFLDKKPSPKTFGKQVVPSSTMEYELRMKERHQRLQDYMQKKHMNQRHKIAVKQKREDDRQNAQNKLIWESKPMRIKGQQKLYDGEHDPASHLMFDGKSCEQYYRERYFEEVLGMNVPQEYMAEHKQPTVVRPSYVMRSTKTNNRANPVLSKSQQPHDILKYVSIEEPTIVKYNIHSYGQNEGEDRTMNRYRYYNQDKKGIRYITTRKPVGTFELLDAPLMAIGSSLGVSAPGTTLKLPVIGKVTK
jgi:hypothetical protein